MYRFTLISFSPHVLGFFLFFIAFLRNPYYGNRDFPLFGIDRLATGRELIKRIRKYKSSTVTTCSTYFRYTGAVCAPSIRNRVQTNGVWRVMRSTPWWKRGSPEHHRTTFGVITPGRVEMWSVVVICPRLALQNSTRSDRNVTGDRSDISFSFSKEQLFSSSRIQTTTQ